MKKIEVSAFAVVAVVASVGFFFSSTLPINKVAFTSLDGNPAIMAPNLQHEKVEEVKKVEVKKTINGKKVAKMQLSFQQSQHKDCYTYGMYSAGTDSVRICE